MIYGLTMACLHVRAVSMDTPSRLCSKTSFGLDKDGGYNCSKVASRIGRIFVYLAQQHPYEHSAELTVTLMKERERE
jgi:hypothetical protein